MATITITYEGEQVVYTDELLCKTTAEVIDLLEQYGAAVRSDVLSEDETSNFVDDMLASLESITEGAKVWEKITGQDGADVWTEKDMMPFDRSRPESARDVMRHLGFAHGGLCQHWNLGHVQAAWDVRQNPKVAEVFSAVHSKHQKREIPPEDMLVSFDGVNLSLGATIPDNKRKVGMYKHHCWLHLDQAFAKNSFCCLQSLVNGNNVFPGDATLEVLLGSHLFFNKFAEHFDLRGQKQDWFMLKEEHVAWYEAQGCRRVRLCMPAGSQAFWDSRTVHCGAQAIPTEFLPKELVPEERLPRIAVYVCMEPATPSPKLFKACHKRFCKAVEKAREKRRDIFDPEHPDFLRMTPHWPIKTNLFSRYPRTYGAPVPVLKPIVPPVLTPYGKRIAGLL